MCGNSCGSKFVLCQRGAIPKNATLDHAKSRGDDGASVGACFAPSAERGGTRAAEDRVFSWGGAGSHDATEEMRHAEHSIHSERAKTSAISEVEAGLYDDIEREAIAQRVTRTLP